MKKQEIPKDTTKQVKTTVEKKEVGTRLTLRYPVPGGEITSPFGLRKGEYHRGVDIAAPIGTTIRACLDGIVVRAGQYKIAEGYGNSVLIKHDGNIYTYYAHLYKIEVKRQQKVTAGQKIGEIGNTGKSRGPHLHLELIRGKKLYDPVLYFEAKYIGAVKDILQNFKQGIPLHSCIRWLMGDK